MIPEIVLKQKLTEEKLRREESIDTQIKKALDQCVEMGIEVVWSDRTSLELSPNSPYVSRIESPVNILKLLNDKIEMMNRIKNPPSRQYEEYYKKLLLNKL